MNNTFFNITTSVALIVLLAKKVSDWSDTEKEFLPSDGQLTVEVAEIPAEQILYSEVKQYHSGVVSFSDQNTSSYYNNSQGLFLQVNESLKLNSMN